MDVMDVMDEYHCAANMRSAAVLDAHIKALNQAIAGHRVRNRGKKGDPEGLVRELEAAQGRFQKLGIAVQTGELTPGEYIAELEEKIRREIVLAKEIKGGGVLGGSREMLERTIERVKVMKAEVENIKGTV